MTGCVQKTVRAQAQPARALVLALLYGLAGRAYAFLKRAQPESEGNQRVIFVCTH